ncbi:MAG: glycerol-3-phosphate dehydrogenase [Clostridiales bacterium]|jgi:glycerol-3-phosphate dehydrogenase (NAD(P)+)|nr:glycerol-3-phosphate dehydrogenase [Clostridiales bacterium]
MSKNQASVIGCGRWGSFLAWYLAEKTRSERVLLYGKPNSETFAELYGARRNSYLTLPARVELTDDLTSALSCGLVVVSVGVQDFRTLCRELAQYDLHGKTFLLAMKGLEQDTAKTVSEIFHEEIREPVSLAILAGPGHVQDYLAGIPSCAVIDSTDDTKIKLAELFSGELMKVYYGNDFIGNQIGAALKNVVGIAAGILDGLKWYGLKGSLMVRAPVEVGRFIESRGGTAFTAYGLSHLGDYEATLFSPHSHNRLWGEAFALSKTPQDNKLAEGCHTLRAVYRYAHQNNVYMPIIDALHRAVCEGADIKSEISKLFERGIGAEF